MMIVLLMLLPLLSFGLDANPCSYVKYCSFCTSECPKCKSSEDCLHPIESKRPPNCGYCKFCPLCAVCSVAKATCASLGSWADWVSNAVLGAHASDIHAAPSSQKIDEDIRKSSNINPDEL